MKIYMLKHPSRQMPIALFSEYNLAMDLASRMFKNCSMSEFASCIDEMELDPLKDKMDEGNYPWVVSIDVINGSTEVDDLKDLFKEERLEYTQGRLAHAFVFAPSEEEAENRAAELWAERSDKLAHLKAFTIFRVSIDENGEVSDVQRVEAINYDTMPVQIKTYVDKIEVRVSCSTIDEAISIARDEYDKWIDEQIFDGVD